jgi:hypothetical protein
MSACSFFSSTGSSALGAAATAAGAGAGAGIAAGASSRLRLLFFEDEPCDRLLGFEASSVLDVPDFFFFFFFLSSSSSLSE